MPQEISAEALAKIVNEAVSTAVGNYIALQKSKEVINRLEEEEEKPKAKKGRPKKVKVTKEFLKAAEIESQPDEVKEILEEKEPMPDPKSNYIVSAKRANIQNAGVLQASSAQPIGIGNRKQKFIDYPEVGDRIPQDKYPVPTERRPPAKKGKFNCDKCRKDFEGYYTEYPQALYKERIPGVAEGRPLLYCENCIGGTPAGAY